MKFTFLDPTFSFILHTIFICPTNNFIRSILHFPYIHLCYLPSTPITPSNWAYIGLLSLLSTFLEIQKNELIFNYNFLSPLLSLCRIITSPICDARNTFCGFKVTLEHQSCVSYRLQACVVINDFSCEWVLLFDSSAKWTGKQFYFMLWLQFVIVTTLAHSS